MTLTFDFDDLSGPPTLATATFNFGPSDDAQGPNNSNSEAQSAYPLKALAAKGGSEANQQSRAEPSGSVDSPRQRTSQTVVQGGKGGAHGGSNLASSLSKSSSSFGSSSLKKTATFSGAHQAGASLNKGPIVSSSKTPVTAKKSAPVVSTKGGEVIGKSATKSKETKAAASAHRSSKGSSSKSASAGSALRTSTHVSIEHEKPVDSGLNIPDSEEPHLSKATYWGDDIKRMIEEADKTNDELKKTIVETEPIEEEIVLLEARGIMSNATITYADPIDQDKLMRIDDMIKERLQLLADLSGMFVVDPEV